MNNYDAFGFVLIDQYELDKAGCRLHFENILFTLFWNVLKEDIDCLPK